MKLPKMFLKQTGLWLSLLGKSEYFLFAFNDNSAAEDVHSNEADWTLVVFFNHF